jgi:hypothetical protein
MLGAVNGVFPTSLIMPRVVRAAMRPVVERLCSRSAQAQYSISSSELPSEGVADRAVRPTPG